MTTKTDYCTPSGARLLADMIESYWRERGVTTIKCWIPQNTTPERNSVVHVVWSNLGMWEPSP